MEELDHDNPVGRKRLSSLRECIWSEGLLMPAQKDSITITKGNSLASPSHARVRRLKLLALIILALALISPVWMVEYVPLVDYPDHLARAFILSHLDDPAYKYSDSYEADWGPYPYVALDLSLISAMKLFPAEVAGKVVLSMILLILPICCAFFSHKIGGDALHTGVWAAIVSISGYFLLGFVTMHLSFALAFLALGLWSSLEKHPNSLHWFAVLAAISASYFAHLLGFVLAGTSITLACLFARKPLRHLIFSWLLFVPAGLCYIYSRMSHPNALSLIEWRGLTEKVLGLASVVRGYSTPLDFITISAAAAVVMFGAWRNPEFRINRAWAAVAGALFVLYWIFPKTYASGADADRRLLPFTALLLISSIRFGARTGYLMVAATLLLAIRVANTHVNFQRLQPEQQMMARSIDVIPRDARVLPIVELMDRRHLLRTPHEFWSYGVIRRGWFSPYIFDDPGVHALRIKPVYAPKGFGSFRYREQIDWQQVNSQYDYIWAYNVRSMDPQITQIGTLVFRDGNLDVFRTRRADAPEPQR
jgi:hypothetical protein